MRIHARLLLGMFGLVLAVPTLAAAAPFGDDDAGLRGGRRTAAASARSRHHSSRAVRPAALRRVPACLCEGS